MVQTHPRFVITMGKRAGLWVLMLLAWATGAFADDVLKSQGLIRSGSFYALGSESEVHTKLYEASSQFESFSAAFGQQAAIVESEVRRKFFDLQRIPLRRKIDDINVQLGRFPILRHRNNPQRDAFNQLQTERDACQLTLNEVNSQIGLLNNQAASPKQKQEVQAEVERLRGPFVKAIGEVRVLVDEAKKNYEALARNEEVKNALEMQRRAGKANLKLGPSNEFRADVALLRRYETLVGAGSSSLVSPPKAKAKNVRKAGR